MLKRKELAGSAKKIIKTHYWFLLIVCLIAAFIGSEFTETFNLLKMPVSVYKSISDNPDEERSIEEQGVTFVTTDIDNRTKGALLNAVVSVLMNNEEQGKINSENIIDNAKANAGEILGRTSGILSSVVNSFSSGAVVFMIVDVIYGVTGSRQAVVILLLILSLIVYFGIRYMIKMCYIVISRRIFLESRTYKKAGANKFMFLMRVKRWMHVAWVLFVKDVFTILWSLTVVGAFIKPFSYQLVPYIIAENPNLSAAEAITLSRKMMDGYKWRSFCYSLSFIGWSLLSFVTFGLVGVFFANPYKTAFFTEMYVSLRDTAKENNIAVVEKLCDKYLYEIATDDELKAAYADIYEYMKQEDPEKRFIDDISQSDIRYFKKLRKVLADWFGVILFNTNNERHFEDAKAELESKYGIKVLAVQADVNAGADNESVVKNVVEQAVKEFGRIDVLINNAQASASGVTIADHTTAQFDLAIYSGLYAAFYYMQACYPYLKETKGSVINFASGAGLFGNYGQCAYAAAKEGIRGLTRVAATEWAADGINVNIVCPLAWTSQLENFEKAYPDAFKANVKMPPMGHFGDVEKEIGRACVALASPDFKYMSGETITLEGAMGQRP